MLVQWTRRDLPELGIRVRRVIYRQPSFVVAMLRSWSVVHDWGMQVEAVSFIARLRRTMLSILLEGRGYIMPRSGPRLLGPGDVVESDQLLQEPEGYAGSPLEVITIEWDDDTFLGPARRGDARFSRIGARDVRLLRELVARAEALPPERVILELAGLLRGLGQPLPRRVDLGNGSPPNVARVFALLGDACSRLETQPSLTEVADALARTERQTSRQLRELARGYAHPNESWREFIHDARIGWATQLLSVPGLPVATVAKLAGYRSAIALSHAFSLRGAPTPGTLARTLADRWG